MNSLQRTRVHYVLLLLLVGCASLGIPAADTFNKQVLLAGGLVTSVRQSADTVLMSKVNANADKLAAGEITEEESKARNVLAAKDAQNIQDQATQLRAAIDIAIGLEPLSPKAAEDRLTAAIAALKALQTYLGAPR